MMITHYSIRELVLGEARTRCGSPELSFLSEMIPDYFIKMFFSQVFFTFGPAVMCCINWPISKFSILNLSLSL